MKTDTNPEKIKELLSRGVEEVIDKNHLETALKSGKKLRVKFGIDPTSPDLHLGHSIPLRKLRQFQELGHNVILLIGDFTAQIGDPSGRMTSRKPLTTEQVKENMKEYVRQAGKILDIKKAEIRYNSEWYDKKGLDFVMDISSRFTVARILERDDFQKRLKKDIDISMQEIYYPLMQGYDSVALKADVEIGGTDQLFNLLMGRKVQKKYNFPEQDVITTPLLIGTDGEAKMSKSIGNYIKIIESPIEMFGKVMAIPDQLMWHYFELLTETPMQEVLNMQEQTRRMAMNYKDTKIKLAFEIVGQYHGEEKAQEAKTEFEKVHQRGELPSEMTEWQAVKGEYNILDLLFEAGLTNSKAEAKRMILGKAVEINGQTKTNWQEVIKVESGMVIQVGKRKFLKISCQKNF